MQKLHIMYKEMSIYIFFKSPLIRKINSIICIVYLFFFCTLKQNIRVISFERLTLG